MLGYPHFRKPPFGMIPNDEYLQGFEITQGGDRLFGKMKWDHTYKASGCKGTIIWGFFW